MEVKRNPRDTCVEPDEQSYEKLISSGVCCILVVIGVLTLALTVFSGFAVSLSVKAGESSKVVVYRSFAESNDSRYQGHTRPQSAKEEVKHFDSTLFLYFSSFM